MVLLPPGVDRVHVSHVSDDDSCHWQYSVVRHSFRPVTRTSKTASLTVALSVNASPCVVRWTGRLSGWSNRQRFSDVTPLHAAFNDTTVSATSAKAASVPCRPRSTKISAHGTVTNATTNNIILPNVAQIPTPPPPPPPPGPPRSPVATVRP